MKKKKNIAGTAYWAVLIAGSILLILYCLMQAVPKNLIFQYVTIWILLLLLGAILVFFLPYGKNGKKMDAFMPLLPEPLVLHQRIPLMSLLKMESSYLYTKQLALRYYSATDVLPASDITKAT